MVANINNPKKKWINGRKPDKCDPHNNSCLPFMVKTKKGMYKCYAPWDGNSTTAYGLTKKEAYEKWDALTRYYESM